MTRSLNEKLDAMERALSFIWRTVADAENNHNGRLTKDQRIAIMLNCKHALGIDPPHAQNPHSDGA